MQDEENRKRQAILDKMAKYAGKALQPGRAEGIYGPEHLRTREERVGWLVEPVRHLD